MARLNANLYLGLQTAINCGLLINGGYQSHIKEDTGGSSVPGQLNPIIDSVHYNTGLTLTSQGLNPVLL